MVSLIAGAAWSFAPQRALAQETAPVPDDAGRFTVRFENVELTTFIKFISKVTGRKFVYGERVSGPVTVISPVPVTEAEALVLFESVLSVRGLTTVDDGPVTRIVPLKEALTSGGAVATDGGAEGFATRLLPLRYVQADEIQSVLEPLVSKEGALVAYPATNTIVVSDVGANLARIAHVVSALDIPSHEENVDVIQLHHADATTLAGQLADILTSPRERPARGGKGDKSAQPLGSPREPFKIVPDQRTNSLIVVAGAADARRVREIATSLDRPLDPGDQRINVYYARFADAVQLVDIINGMLTGQQRRSSTRGETKPGSRTNEPSRNVAPPVLASAPQAGPQGQPTTSISSDVRLSADPSTNSVIIDANQQDYRMIKSLLESLDIERPQVFVEAILAEVSLNKTKELGVEWQVGGTVGDATILARTALSALNPALTDPSSLSGLIAAAVSNKTIELPDGTEIPANVALVRALQSDGDINVLSAPTLLTLDNQEAKIVVGQNVPFVTSQGVDLASVNNVFTTVERQDVGIKLTLTPQVAEGDVVILEVQEEVSALVDNPQLNANQVGPTTTIRSAQTTVSVQDGHTAVIGGLISNALQRRASKVPLLGDIPWLGRLFRTDADRDEKVNLIAFLTPHVIRNTGDLQRVSEARRDNFKESRPEVSVPFPATGNLYVIPSQMPGGLPVPPPSAPAAPAPTSGTTAPRP